MAGGLNILQNQFDLLQESLGKPIFPAERSRAFQTERGRSPRRRLGLEHVHSAIGQRDAGNAQHRPAPMNRSDDENVSTFKDFPLRTSSTLENSLVSTDDDRRGHAANRLRLSHRYGNRQLEPSFRPTSRQGTTKIKLGFVTLCLPMPCRRLPQLATNLISVGATLMLPVGQTACSDVWTTAAQDYRA